MAWANEWTGGRFLNFIALLTCTSYHEVKTTKTIGNKEIDGMHKELFTYFILLLYSLTYFTSMGAGM